MTLTDFLLARIYDEQTLAEAASHQGSFWEWPVNSATLAMRYDATRVLAECEAKRRIIGERNDDDPPWIVLRHMATVYADHPDYRPEWKP